jgi:DASS family divalent anion:Na+ symporter
VTNGPVDAAVTLDEPFEQRAILDANRVAATLEATPEFAGWPHHDLARFVPYVWERRLPAGTVLCRRGEPADRAFCMVEGSVRCSIDGRTVSSGFVGHEAALEVPAYLADVVAATDVAVLVVTRDVLREFGITLGGETLFHSLLAHHATAAPASAAAAPGAEADDDDAHPRTTAIGWVLTLAVPALILAFGEGFGLSWRQRDFTAALSICLLMMSFNLTPQYAAALIAGLICLLLDVAPASVILSGFASDGFFMGLGIFGLGAVLTASGLAERVVFNLLRLSPKSPFWYNLTFLMTGIFMTPCLPSANTRVALLTPLVIETSRALGFRDRSREATRLMLSMFVGASLFAPIFLTAKSLNFVIHSQLPTQVHDEFQWLKWTISASVAGLVMLGLYLLAAGLTFRRGEAPRLSRSHLETQLRVLGPIRPIEWIALIITAAFILAIVTYSLHKINPSWITLGVLSVFLVLGTLNEKDIRHSFQWDVLLLVGFFIGLENTLDYTGITAILTEYLSGVTAYMQTNFLAFLAVLGLITALLRLFLPITTAGVLVASVFLPLAAVSGVNAWVVGFSIMMLAETWFLPAQCSYFQTMEDISGERPVHDRALFLRLNAITMAIRLIGLLASIPFFRSIGLL